MGVIGDGTQIFRNRCIALLNRVQREIARLDHLVEQEPYQRRGGSGEQSVRDGVQEDPPGVFACSEQGQRRCYRQCNGGHRHKLKQTRVNRCDEIEKFVQPAAAERSQYAAQHQCGDP